MRVVGVERFTLHACFAANDLGAQNDIALGAGLVHKGQYVGAVITLPKLLIESTRFGGANQADCDVRCLTQRVLRPATHLRSTG